MKITPFIFLVVGTLLCTEVQAQFQRKIAAPYYEMPEAMDLFKRGYVVGGLDLQSPMTTFLLHTNHRGDVEWNMKYQLDNNGQLTILHFADVKNFRYQTNDRIALLGSSSWINATNGKSDIVFATLDEKGNPLQAFLYGTSEYDNGLVLERIENGKGFAIVGETHPAPNPNYFMDITLAIVDVNGNMVMSAVYKAPGRQRIYDIVQTRDRGFALVGETSYYGHSCDGDSVSAFVLKVDKNLNIQWNKVLDIAPEGEFSKEYAYGVEQTGSDEILVLGSSNNSTNNGGLFRAAPFLMVLDKYGNLQWIKTYGIRNGSYTYPQPTGRSLVTRDLPGGNVEHAFLGTRTSTESMIFTTDAVGNPTWCMVYNGGNNLVWPTELVRNLTDGFAFVGRTSGTTTFNDIHLGRTDDFGKTNTACELKQDPLQFQPKYCELEIPIDRVDKLGVKNIRIRPLDWPVKEFDCEYNTLASLSTPGTGLLYPNPAKDYLYFEGISPKEATILDLSGLPIKSVLVQGEGLPVYDLAPGLYIVEVSVPGADVPQRYLFQKE